MVKTTIFNQFWQINDQNPLNWLWQVRMYHQKPFFPIFENFHFFEIKCWVTNGKKQIFSKSQKKLFHLNLFIRPHVGNLFTMVSMIIAAKFTHFEKSRKNTFLVNWKKWKKWEKGSSKWNHPKMALTNCHYFLNSDPHAKN